MKTVAALWQSYVDDVLPKHAGAVQRQETRRAFYAGAQAFFHAVAAGLSEGAEPTDEDVQSLEALHGEFKAFARDVAAGKA